MKDFDISEDFIEKVILQNNLLLSLIERQENSKRIYDKAYGKSKFRNSCVDGVKCTEKQHQLNRRTEFKIIKI